MPRVELHVQDPNELKLVEGQWRYAIGLVPGEPNEGLVANLANSPARLADYDDSSWETADDITAWHSRGFSFIWYRTSITLPDSIKGRPVEGTRLLFETCIDDYGEIWIDGECDRAKGTVQGFNIPQRVEVSANPKPGDTHTIALLAINGPIAAPGGAVFVRYATLAFEWRGEGY